MYVCVYMFILSQTLNFKVYVYIRIQTGIEDRVKREREKWTQEGIRPYKLKCLLRDCGKEVSLALVTFHVLFSFFFPWMFKKNNLKNQNCIYSNDKKVMSL